MELEIESAKVIFLIWKILKDLKIFYLEDMNIIFFRQMKAFEKKEKK